MPVAGTRPGKGDGSARAETMAIDRDLAPESDAEERPPLGSWPRLYALVIGELALLVLLFTLFAHAFR